MTNRIAVVVFSWNRPDYLIRMLDSLAKNTVIDDCDVYLWNDGWRNDPTYPYATDENEEKVHVLVDQCEEILNTFPFKHKEVITRTDNVCIGRQLQEAKARLFNGSLIDDAPRGVVADLPTYDNVIFFDDDHVVSKNYIDILLKLHEQYPDAIVGAQASEIRNIPRDAELDEVGVTLKQGGIDDTRPGRWRWLGYLLPKAVYEATLEEMNEYMEFIGPSYRNIPHEAVRVKYGVMITGFDGVMDKILDNHKIRRIATVIPRAKYIGESGLFGSPRLFKAMGFAHNLNFEFDDEPETLRVRDGCDDKG
jgi:hypothetical protein